MSQLTFWNPSATPAMRRIQATALANQIDNVFRIIRGAKYEKNVTQQKAIDNTVKTLLDAEQTICDLAKECDDNYLFWKEGDE
jgi:predicted GNAT superfamily acetyltransferase